VDSTSQMTVAPPGVWYSILDIRIKGLYGYG